jgi:Uma2 family endonuclease
MPRNSAVARLDTIAQLLEQLGNISPQRVRLNPPPGRATERDLIKLHDRTNRLYELVDGTLVEKVMGSAEAYLAMELGRLLGNFAGEHDLGPLFGPDGAVRLFAGLVRIPDICFIRWTRLAGHVVPHEPVIGLVPDLAVEVLSESNTEKEMERKLKEYFLGGVRLVWFVDPRQRTVQVFTTPDQSTLLTEEQTLGGGDVLPGLAIPLRKLFGYVARSAPPAPRKERPSTPPKKRRRK